MKHLSGTSTALSKAEAIFLCLSEPEVDLWRLRELALSDGGLLNDVIRRIAWPKLVGIDRYAVMGSHHHSAASDLVFESNESGIPSEAEMDQVQRDAIRCTWHLLTFDQRRKWRGGRGNGTQEQQQQQRNSKDESHKVASLLRKKQRRLGHLINMILQEGGGLLKYYQGYHDVSSVFLNTLGTDGLAITKATLYQVSLSHFREPMRDSFQEIICVLRLTIFPLLAQFNLQLHNHLENSGMEPFFALSWVLSWFSHDIKDIRVAARLFDAFIVSHPLLPIYVSVAMLLHPVNRNIILKTESDFGEIHNVLCSLPKNTCSYGWRNDGGYGSDDEFDKEYDGRRKSMLPLVPVQELLDSAIYLMQSVPPRDLLPLSRRYRKGALVKFANSASNISLFQPPQPWSLVASAPADWVLKRRAKADEGHPDTTPKMGAKLLSDGTPHTMYEKALLNLSRDCDEEHLKICFDNRSRNKKVALVASGLGNADNWKRQMLIGGILVAILSIAWAYFYNWHGFYPSVSTAGARLPSAVNTQRLDRKPKFFNIGKVLKQMHAGLKKALSDDNVIMY